MTWYIFIFMKTMLRFVMSRVYFYVHPLGLYVQNYEQSDW